MVHFQGTFVHFPWGGGIQQDLPTTLVGLGLFQQTELEHNMMTESAVALGVVGIDRLGGGLGGGGRPEFQICRSVLAQKWAIVGSEEAKKTPQIPAKMALSSI